MADLEEGEVSDSDEDSRCRVVQEHSWRSKSTSRPKEGKVDVSYVERTQSSSSHQQPNSSQYSELRVHKSHFCNERSFCRSTFQAQHCLVRNKTFKHKQLNWIDSWRGNYEEREMRIEKTTGSKCYISKPKSTVDSYDRRNTKKTKKKSRLRKEKEIVGRDNIDTSKDNGADFGGVSKTMSRKQTVVLTQNDDNPLMHKLINAGLAKKAPSNSSDLHVEVGSIVSVSSPEFDIWTDYSTLSDDAVDNNKSAVPNPNGSDSDIEVIIPPKKIPTVVTLDSDGEEVNEAGGDGFEKVSILFVGNQSTSVENFNKTPDKKMNSTNINSNNTKYKSDIVSDVSKFSDNTLTQSIYSDDESPNYSPSSPSSIGSVEVFGDGVESTPLENVATFNTKLQPSTTNTSVTIAGINTNKGMNLMEMGVTNQSKDKNCIINHPDNVNQQDFIIASGIEQTVNQPKQAISKLNLVGDKQFIISSKISMANKNDQQSKQQQTFDNNSSPSSAVNSYLSNCHVSDHDSEPYSPFSLYGTCSKHSQNICSSNSNTYKVTNCEFCTTPSPSSSFSCSYNVEKNPQKVTNNSIPNSNGNHIDDSFALRSGSIKNDVLDKELKLLDEQEPYSPFSLYGTCSKHSQNICSSNSNTYKVTNCEFCTTPSPSSSFSCSYNVEKNPQKVTNNSISNSNCNHIDDSFALRGGSIKNIDKELKLLDEQEPYSPCSNYESTTQDINPMVSNNNKRLCSFQSKGIAESSDSMVVINDNLHKLVPNNTKHPLECDNINDNHNKKCSNKDVGKLSDDDEDLSKLRLIALSSKRKNNQNVLSVLCNKGIACKDSDSNTSEDLLVNEEEDVLKLRVAALKSAVIKKHEERKKMGVVIKKRKRRNSSLIDDLIPSDPEKIINECGSNGNLTPTPPSPAKSTISMQGEEDMEISDSNSENVNQDSITNSTVLGSCSPRSSCNLFNPLIQTCSQDYPQINDDSILEGITDLHSKTNLTPSQPLPPGVDASVRDLVVPIASPLESMLPCLFAPPPPPPFPPTGDPHILPHDASSEFNQHFDQNSSIPSSHEYIDSRLQTGCKAFFHKSIPGTNISNSEVNPVNSADECQTPQIKDKVKRLHINQSLKCYNVYNDGTTATNKKPLGKQNRYAIKRTLQVIPLVKSTPKKLTLKKRRNKSDWLKKTNKSQHSKKTIKRESNVLCITDVSSSSKLHKKVNQTLMQDSTPLCSTSPFVNRIPVSSLHSANEEVYCKDNSIESDLFKNKLSNNEIEMDLAEMIVLDEVGMSPEHRAEDELTPRVQTQTMSSLSNSPSIPCISSKRTPMRPVTKSSVSQPVSNINTSNHLISSTAAINHYNKTGTQGLCISACASANSSNIGKNLIFSEEYETAMRSVQNNISLTRKVDVNDSHKYKLSRVLKEPRRCVVQARHSLKVVVPSESAPVVERLVINIGLDSDSEDDSEWLRQVRVQDPVPVPPGPVIDEDLERSIDLLLMKARQNSDNHSSLQSSKHAGNPTENDYIADTPLKLLPIETQKEYQRLKKIIEEKEKQQKLKTALLHKELKQLGASDTSTPGVNNRAKKKEVKCLPKQRSNNFEVRDVVKNNTFSDKISKLSTTETIANHSCEEGVTESSSMKYSTSQSKLDIISSKPCAFNTLPNALVMNSRDIQNQALDYVCSGNLHSDKESFNISSFSTLANDGQHVELNKNIFHSKVENCVNQTNSSEILESSKEKCELHAYKNPEELSLASSQAELISERFTLVDAATQVREEITELERQIALESAAETELRRLREVIAHVESELESLRSSRSEQQLKVVDLLSTLDTRQEHVGRLEHDCCILGTQLCSPGYQLPSTGKELMLQKLLQVRDRSGKLLNKSLTYDEDNKKLDSSSKQDETLQHLCRLDKTATIEEPQHKAIKLFNVTKLQKIEETAVNKNVYNPKLTSASSCTIGQGIELPGTSPDNTMASCTRVDFPHPPTDTVDKPDMCKLSPNSLNISNDESQSKKSKINLSKQQSKHIDDHNLTNNLNKVYFKRHISEDCVETNIYSAKRPNKLQAPKTLPCNSLKTANTKSCMKYKSLLQYKEFCKRLNVNRSSIDVLCPYDLSGKCQDSHCPYQHLQIS